MIDFLWLIPLPALLGSVVNGVFGRYLSKGLVTVAACGSAGLSFVLSLVAVLDLLSRSEDDRVVTQFFFTWIESGDFIAKAEFLFDPLSAVMLLVVTGVGFLIHVYSVGYMHGDPGYHRFYAYLNLFMFSMLILVLSHNLLLMFVGWEGVGLCSYLLIGFYFDRKSAADAGKKAFIVNRIGDVGFVLGIFLTFIIFGSLDFSAIFGQIDPMSQSTGIESGIGPLTAIGLLLLVGAVGKSAQIPLYVWLPDAMEGPTPVSALIHAATMVTAGVYMVVRCSPIYAHAPVAMQVVAVIGIATALMAATIALAQRDIKRVLAYSTVSQLGYMFVAAGVGAFSAAIFHVMTHAFFKALLFLGAGSVIHSLSGEQDMTKMGGLRRHIPITYWTMLMGALAISGFFPFAGFFSKDEILWSAWANDHRILWALGVVTAALTAFYMFRLIFLTFHGSGRLPAGSSPQVHESPPSMTIPLGVLALLSVFGGFIGLPAWLGHNVFSSFMEGRLGSSLSDHPHAPASHGEEVALAAISFAVALGGIALAYRCFLSQPDRTSAIVSRFSSLHRLLVQKYYVDEIYDSVVVHPISRGSEIFLWKLIDVRVIDGIVNGAGRLVRTGAEIFKHLQNGLTRSYASWIVLGSLVVLFYFYVVSDGTP